MWAGNPAKDEGLMARIREAAKRAHIHHHIETLPESYHTVVIIAHRLSTIRNVDHVYVFDQWRLVEDGQFDRLRDREDSKFGRLVAAQHTQHVMGGFKIGDSSDFRNFRQGDKWAAKSAKGH